MKKILAVALIVVMALAFAACGGGSSSASKWEKFLYVDDFDDATDDWYVSTTEYATGTYSTKDVKEEKLKVELLVDDMDVSIFLHEDDETLIEDPDEDVIYNVVLTDAKGKGHSFYGIMESGSDRVYLDKDGIKKVIKALKGEGEISISIVDTEDEKTEYFFKVGTGNFADIYDKAKKGE